MCVQIQYTRILATMGQHIRGCSMGGRETERVAKRVRPPTCRCDTTLSPTHRCCKVYPVYHPKARACLTRGFGGSSRHMETSIPWWTHPCNPTGVTWSVVYGVSVCSCKQKRHLAIRRPMHAPVGRMYKSTQRECTTCLAVQGEWTWLLMLGTRPHNNGIVQSTGSRHLRIHRPQQR